MESPALFLPYVPVYSHQRYAAVFRIDRASVAPSPECSYPGPISQGTTRCKKEFPQGEREPYTTFPDNYPIKSVGRGE